MLTDIQLKVLSKKMGFSLEEVVFKDELPKKVKCNMGYIINLEDEFDDEGHKNTGTHWTALYIKHFKHNGIDTYEPIYFDPYGVPPSEWIKKCVETTCGKKLPYTTKDIQSLMNNSCGWYCCAFLHFINVFAYRSKDLYEDVNGFMDLFDDLNTSIDFKKNEYILKMFFQSNDASKRKDIDVLPNPDTINGEDVGNGVDLLKIPVGVNIMNTPTSRY
jgi:hypothetical protein